MIKNNREDLRESKKRVPLQMIDKVGCQYYGFVKAAQRMSLLHFSINIKLFNYEQKVFYFFVR